jgi:hypothetical protein
MREISVVKGVEERELRLFTDWGRCMRPLFLVDLRRQFLQAEGGSFGRSVLVAGLSGKRRGFERRI